MKMIYHLSLLLIAVSYARAGELEDTISCMNQYVATYQSRIDPLLYRILAKAFPNTIATTVQHYDLTNGSESTYIITGDIEAMWLRDSTNQFIPYIRTPNNCTHVPAFTRGILNTQAQFIMTDPYTNAFKKFEQSKSSRPSYLNDTSQILLMGIPLDLCRGRQFATPSIWQRKFQIDSLAAFLRLAYQYYSKYRSIQFLKINFFKAIERILTVLEQETRDTDYERSLGQKYYSFYRNNEELPAGSIRFALRTGMVKTGFRPSDSPNQLPYNIPGNAMMASYLKLVAQQVMSQVPASSVFSSWSKKLASQMLTYAESIRTAIYRHGIVWQGGVQIFAYEVDGRGNYRIYDDSNIPSLMSLPYLGFVDSEDEIYQNTRRFLLSQRNQYFYARSNISGIGSSHTEPRYIWPLALITQIVTSKSKKEIANCLESLLTSAKHDLMHQSFSVDDPAKITREWFAWANSFFGEMIVTLQ